MQRRIPKKVLGPRQSSLTLRFSWKSEELPSRSPRQGLPGAFRNTSVCCWTIQTRWIFHEAVTLASFNSRRHSSTHGCSCRCVGKARRVCQSNCDCKFPEDVGGPHLCETQSWPSLSRMFSSIRCPRELQRIVRKTCFVRFQTPIMNHRFERGRHRCT